MWHGDHYAYRDRESHVTSNGWVILDEGNGDTEHIVDHALLVPNRLVIKIEGGKRHVPKVTLHIAGINTEGEPIRETANVGACTPAGQHSHRSIKSGVKNSVASIAPQQER